MMRMVGIRLARVGTGALACPGRAQLGSRLRLASFIQREKKRKHRATPWRILDMDRPMMAVHDLRNNGEAEPYAGLLRGHKRVENLFAQLVGNTRAGVGEAEFQSFPIVLCSASNLDPQRAGVIPILHGLVGVLNKIEEGLLAQALVERDGRQPAGVVTLDAHRITWES